MKAKDVLNKWKSDRTKQIQNQDKTNQDNQLEYYDE
jgi:hypothetical protein